MRLAALHALSLRAQVVLAFASVAFVAGALTYTFVLAAVEVALEDASEETVRAVRAQLALVVGAVITCTIVASFGAATLLRQSLGATIQTMRSATDEIANGCFHHRVRTTRRDELGALARDIDRMAERLQSLEQSRHRLLASVSHELRTPLTVLRCTAYSLGRGEQDELRRERFALVDQEAERLAAMIDDLLTAATLRARGARLNRERCDVEPLLQEVAARFRESATSRGVQVRIAAAQDARGLAVPVDRQRFAQVLGNLVDNAVRHARPGSAVTVGAERSSGQVVRIYVENKGEDIPPDLVGDLFDPFVQADPHKSGAVGLGLSIARELVSAHSSDLMVHSEGGTTRFWFDLAECTARHKRRTVLTTRFA